LRTLSVNAAYSRFMLSELAQSATISCRLFRRRHIFKLVDFSMSEAIRSIVDGYFSLKDRTALEELRAHRQRLRKRLQDQPKSWVDSSSTIRVLDEDLDVIEAALRRF
jgi:hypothetical protein